VIPRMTSLAVRRIIALVDARASGRRRDLKSPGYRSFLARTRRGPQRPARAIACSSSMPSICWLARHSQRSGTGCSTAASSGPGDHDYAGIDIFRFDDDGKVVEHWDVLQIVPEHSANDNGMF
jgi:hypothetical protein